MPLALLGSKEPQQVVSKTHASLASVMLQTTQIFSIFHLRMFGGVEEESTVFPFICHLSGFLSNSFYQTVKVPLHVPLRMCGFLYLLFFS